MLSEYEPLKHGSGSGTAAPLRLAYRVLVQIRFSSLAVTRVVPSRDSESCSCVAYDRSVEQIQLLGCSTVHCKVR